MFNIISDEFPDADGKMQPIFQNKYIAFII
jgi:hypothetical protein